MRASRVSAGYGAKVAIAEAGRFGGTCVNVGCIPKKLFSYAAHFREDFEIARGYGWTVGEPRFDWPTLLANKDREIARLNGVYERVLVNAGVEIHRARRARSSDPHTVEVGGRKLHCKAHPGRHRLLAGAAADSRHRARDHLERGVPRSSACRGARSWSAAATSRSSSPRSSTASGVETTLTYRGKRLLRGFDAELGTRIAEEMAAKGVDDLLRLRAGGDSQGSEAHRNRIHRRQPAPRPTS